MAIKKQNSHISTRKKASTSRATSSRAKKAAAKATKPATKASAKKKAEELARQKRLKKLEQLTLRMFQEVYDDYQQGKFHRIL